MDRNGPTDKTVDLIIASDARYIEMTLVSDYGLPREEAARLTKELCEWFDRLARRPGTPAAHQSLRYQLISMTCKVGHVYWTGKGVEQPSNETVRRTLALGPEIIAFEVEKRLEETERPPRL
jgi:hypothetical protein